MITGPASLPAGTEGQAYPASTIAAGGGTPPYGWSATGLPPGLAIDPNSGTITGTPAAGASSGSPYTVVVTVKDAVNATATRNYSLTVMPSSTGQSILMTIGNGSGSPNQNVEVPIQMTSPANLVPVAAGTDATYDPSKLTFVSARAGETCTSSGKSIVESAPGSGVVRLGCEGFNQNAIPNGNWGYITFKLSSSFTTGTTPVQSTNCQTSDKNGQLIATVCPPPPGIITANCGCPVNPTIADVQSVINQFLAGAQSPCHSGSVNIADVQKVINAFLGLPCSSASSAPAK